MPTDEEIVQAQKESAAQIGAVATDAPGGEKRHGGDPQDLGSDHQLDRPPATLADERI